ncbi:MAG: hypothetical protein WC666_00410 [Candidatus Paceibacterota bacterium]
MKNKYEKLSFIKALIDQLDNLPRVPAKIYFNYTSPNFDITEQKEVLAELKKKKLISSYRWSDDDFIITKPSRRGLFEYWQRLNTEPVPEQKQVDTRIVFNEKIGEITRGAKVCPIPINTNQYFLCKALFDKKFGTDVTETDIVDMADWAKDTKRSVYDARGAVNKRVKEKLGINNFIRWRTGRVRIDYEQK